MSARPLFVVLLTLVACGSPAAPRTDLAPPRGMTPNELRRSLQPQRPADTVETDKMTMHVIDIGQGLAVLLEFPCGAILVDTGGELNEVFDSPSVLRAYLKDFFARRTDLDGTLDALVITHPHIDHTRGIDVALSEARVKNVVTNGQEHEDVGGPEQARLHAWVAEVNTDPDTETIVGIERVAAASIPDVGLASSTIDPVGACDASAIDPVVTALWGRVSGVPDYPVNPNDHSVVLRVDFGDASALLTGDLELEGLAALGNKYADHPELLDIDVYLVGHHGSKNATAPHLMRAMTPKVAVVSAGAYQRNYEWTARAFGHPNIQAIEVLRNARYGVAWYRDSKTVWMGIRGAWEDAPSEFEQRVLNHAIYSTGWDGTVDVRLYGNGWIEVDTASR